MVVNICPQCGKDVQEGAKFCHHCGASLDGSAPAPAGSTSPSPPSSPFAPRQDEPESEIWHGGFSGKAMFGWWVGAGVATVLLFALWIGVFPPFSYKWWILCILLLILWGWPLVKLAYKKLSVRYRLTTQRLIHESGILRRTTNRIEMIDMDDISVSQGLFEQMMGVGTVTILSSDTSDPKMVLSGIDNVRHVAERMDEVRRRERLRRGLHIESV